MCKIDDRTADGFDGKHVYILTPAASTAESVKDRSYIRCAARCCAALRDVQTPPLKYTELLPLGQQCAAQQRTAQLSLETATQFKVQCSNVQRLCERPLKQQYQYAYSIFSTVKR